MIITDYIIGLFVWCSLFILLWLIYIKLVLSSLIYTIAPTLATPPPPMNVAENMTQLVSHYGFREEIHDISGVKIHCVIKDATPTTPTTPTTTTTTTTDTSSVFVFIHGTASSSATFFDTMKALHPTMKCVAIDLPTFGISGHIDIDIYPTNEKLCTGYADVIGHTLHKLEIIDQTILVAHSLGGFLSIYVANRFPIKKLVLLNPAGILPTLGVWGYYWALFFKTGLPTVAFHFPMVSPELLIYLGRWWWLGWSHICNYSNIKTEFWLSFYANKNNEGHRIVQRLITLRPFYSFWNTPAITTLMDVYKKVPTSICFGVSDTVCPSHIGYFLRQLTQDEIIIHNIQNANHNPCENIAPMVEFVVSISSDTYTKTPKSWRKISCRKLKKHIHLGYSYHSLQKTQDSIQNVYDYLIMHNNSENGRFK